MKTMKRFLCAALVLALCLAFCAADFADQSDIGERYTAAVNAMAGMGILEGKSESDAGVRFEPQGGVTRAEAAKLISYILLGREAAEKLTAAAAPFADVPASHWAAPYITYVKQQSIISGALENADGSVSFLPEAGVTGFEFAKMLLGAVGYGKNGEYDGAGKAWATAVGRHSLTLGLFNGDLSAMSDNALTRQQASLVAYNAMTRAQVVTYSNGAYTPQGHTLAGANFGYTQDSALLLITELL